MTRLFVAAELPDPVRASLAAAVAPLHERLPGWRWGRAEQWHLTLAFLGEVDESRMAGLERRLSRAAGRHGGLEIVLAGFGAFASARRAQVLWAGVDG
ncbi:MAG: RNA 2',3'-cyclic phosphodiesterase, partial [Actinomycetota bacterium]|nr:RNA 2',3'-cyclic phosphodiesterase [Actinomycetota bacterium]